MLNVYQLRPVSAVRDVVLACFESAVREHVVTLSDEQLVEMLKSPLDEGRAELRAAA